MKDYNTVPYPSTPAEIKHFNGSEIGMEMNLLWCLKKYPALSFGLRFICRETNRVVSDGALEKELNHYLTDIATAYDLPTNEVVIENIVFKIITDYDIQEEGAWLTW